MKKIQAVVACGIALALLSATSIFAAEAGPSKATVRAVHGSAEFYSGANWSPLRPNMELGPGTQIRTGPDSYVSLNVNGYTSSIRVTENTTVTLDRMATMSGSDTDTSLKLDTGTVIGQVKKLSANSRYEIQTPNGVAGIRGTDIAVTVVPKPDGTYTTTFTSITGELVCSGVVGNETVVKVLHDGQSWTVGLDVVPTPAPILDFDKSVIASFGQPSGNLLPPPPFPVPFNGNGAPQIGNGSAGGQSTGP